LKNRYIIGPVVGAAIGLILAYFSTSSVSAINLSVAAGIGALVGLFIVARASVPVDGATCGGQTGMG